MPTPNDTSDWCPMCGPGLHYTIHGHCLHCGSQLILRSVLQKLYDQAAHEFAVAVRRERGGMADDQPKIATGGNCERTSMASLTNPAATPEECECYASGVVLGVMTSASPLVVASLLVALRDAWAGHHPEITRVTGELAERFEKLEEIKRLRRQLMLGRDLSRELLHHAEPDGWYAAELRSKFRAWLELTDEQR